MALGVPARENENGRLKSDDIKEHLQRFGYEELAPRLFVKDLKKRLQTKVWHITPLSRTGAQDTYIFYEGQRFEAFGGFW